MIAETSDIPTVLDDENRHAGKVYAEALLEAIAETDESFETVAEQLPELCKILQTTEGAMDLLTSPAITRKKRIALVRRIFDSQLTPSLEALMSILARNNRIGSLPALCEAFQKVRIQRAGKVEVRVRSARPLAPDQRESMAEALRESLGRPVVLRERVEADLLGGIVVQIGETVYDASLSRQIDRLCESLSRGRTS